MLQKFVKDQSGATAIEYALIAGLLSVAIIGALNAVADGNSANYDTIETAIADANN